MRALFLSLAACAVLAAACASRAGGEPAPAGRKDPFPDVASVLRHPRCLNCHTVTDFPRVGDDRLPHAMHVVRGPDGAGAPAMRCESCHQPHNQPLIGVPGAPGWKLAPLAMGWEGLDDHQLAQALKDPARNGGRSLAQLYEHMAHDALVLWAWDPAHGRSLPPLTHEQFTQALRAWIDAGAPVPAPGTHTGN